VVERLAVPTSGEDDAAAGLEADEVATLDVVGDTAVTLALLGVLVVSDREVHHVELVVHRDAALDDLLVHRVEQVVTGLGTRVGRAGEREATEGTLGDAAVVLAGERHPPVLQLDRLFGTHLTEGLDGRGVAQVVRALHGVVGVVVPVVAGAERGVDAALRGARVRAHRVELRDDGHVGSLLVGRDGRAEAGAPTADDDDVVFVHSWI
jgi:hypothetical protein